MMDNSTFTEDLDVLLGKKNGHFLEVDAFKNPDIPISPHKAVVTMVKGKELEVSNIHMIETVTGNWLSVRPPCRYYKGIYYSVMIDNERIKRFIDFSDISSIEFNYDNPSKKYTALKSIELNLNRDEIIIVEIGYGGKVVIENSSGKKYIFSSGYPNEFSSNDGSLIGEHYTFYGFTGNINVDGKITKFNFNTIFFKQRVSSVRLRIK